MEITIRRTYYNKGFFNVPVAFTGLFGNHNSYLSIDTVNGLIDGCRVDRLSNRNGTPRIWLNRHYKYWFQENYQLGDVIEFEIVNQVLLKVV